MTSENIYFDSAAAMRPHAAVLDFFGRTAARFYANQEAIHAAARELKLELDGAARLLSGTLCDREMMTFFASSGTDAIRLATALTQLRGGNVVCSALEHAAILANLKATGLELRCLPIDLTGAVIPGRVGEVVDKETSLVILHHVQSETGRIQPWMEIASAIRSAGGKEMLLVCDAIQSAGKLSLKGMDFDGCLLSGHKFGSIGAAALLLSPDKMREKEHLQRFRSVHYQMGRVEPAYAMTLAFAAEYAVRQKDDAQQHVKMIHELLRHELGNMALPNGRKVIVSLQSHETSPYILHVRLPGYQGAVLTRLLSERGIYVSSGSACQSETNKPSPALLAMGVKKEMAYSGLRLSFAPRNTRDEAIAFLAEFRDVLRNY